MKTACPCTRTCFSAIPVATLHSVFDKMSVHRAMSADAKSETKMTSPESLAVASHWPALLAALSPAAGGSDLSDVVLTCKGAFTALSSCKTTAANRS